LNLTHGANRQQFDSHCERGSVRKSERAHKQVDRKNAPSAYLFAHTHTHTHTHRCPHAHRRTGGQQRADWSAETHASEKACALGAILKGGNRR